MLSAIFFYMGRIEKSVIMGGKTKSAKRCVMVNGVIFSGLQGVLRAIFGTLKT